jgi:hypothetical protein
MTALREWCTVRTEWIPACAGLTCCDPMDSRLRGNDGTAEAVHRLYGVDSGLRGIDLLRPNGFPLARE